MAFSERLFKKNDIITKKKRENENRMYIPEIGYAIYFSNRYVLHYMRTMKMVLAFTNKQICSSIIST